MFDTLSPINEMDERGGLSRYRMGPNWMNFGNTPADNVTFFVCDPVITDSPAPPNLACNLSDKVIPSGPLGPKQRLHVLGVSIKPEDYDATQYSKRHIFVFGYSTYTDGLRPEKVHQTRFCQVLIKSAAAVPPGSPDFIAGGCQEGGKWSCFDDGCFGDPLARQ
jgi:hypothetical protein